MSSRLAGFAASGARRHIGTAAAAVGVVAAGAALLELALVPAIVIGGAAVLAPRLLPNPLFGPRRRPALPGALTARPAAAKPAEATLGSVARSSGLPRFRIGQAVAKTITFRIIVTSLDFTTNYVVIGELATAAGLSAFSLAVGPLFYLAHEALWNRFGPPERPAPGRLGTAIEVPISLELRDAGGSPQSAPGGFTISRALAKTITFRTIATTMDFTVNYVVTGDLGMAVLLSATGAILGPFVYFGHEMAWDRFGPAAGTRAA